MLLGSVASVGSFTVARHFAEEESAKEFRVECDTFAVRIQQRFEMYAGVLQNAAGLFAASNHVDRQEWCDYAEYVDPIHRFPGMFGIAFVERVEHEDLDDFVADAHADGVDDFEIRQPINSDLQNPDGPHYIIKYHEPDLINHDALGLDLATRSANRRTYDLAMESGDVCLSEGLELVQDKEQRKGLVLAHPVYHNGEPVSTVAERRASLYGWVAVPIGIRQLIQSDATYDSDMLSIDLREENSGVYELLYESPSEYEADGNGLRRSIHFTFAGRKLQLLMKPASADVFATDLTLAYTLLVTGSVISLTLSLLTGVLVHSRAQATSDSQRVQRENRSVRVALEEHTLFSISDRHGKIIDVNPGFCQISGYSREELIGQDDSMLNSGIHPSEFWAEMWETIASGRPWRAEVCNRAKDGSLYWVDSTIVPYIGKDGKPEKYVSIRIDITAKKAAERDIAALRTALDEHSIMSIADAQGRIIDVNTGFCKVSGYSREELIGQDHKVLNSRRHRREFWVNMWKTVASGRAW
ncbi:MAG: CHASE domain-containing protein, partial [Planctomycetota bacterium]